MQKLTKFIIGVTLAIAAASSFANSEVATKECYTMQAPPGTRANHWCRNVVQSPSQSDEAGITLKPSQNITQSQRQTASASSDASAASDSAASILSQDKSYAVSFAAPASTVVPQSLSYCTKANSSARSLTIISWSDTVHVTDKFCAYMLLSDQYEKRGMGEKALQMLEKATETVDQNGK